MSKTARDVIATHNHFFAGMHEQLGGYHADEIIAELDAAGFVLVPKEPNEAMQKVQVPSTMVPGDTEPFMEFWHAMIAASQPTK